MYKRILIALACVGLLFSAALAQKSDEAKPAEPAKEGDSSKAEPAKGDPTEALALRILGKKHVTNDLRTAVDKGVKRLAELQDNNGAFTRNNGGGISVAVTSLAGLALLASGSTPDQGPYQTHIQKAMDYLLSPQVQDPNTGFFAGTNDGSRIHGHGYATLFLAQCYGMQPSNQKLKKSLTKAVEIIVKGQTRDGGWGYMPDDLTWDEGSTTVCCIQALRTASDAGIMVDNKAITNAIQYLYDTAVPTDFMTPDGTDHRGFTFMYSKSSGSSSHSYAITAAAISSLNGVGIYAEGATWRENDIGKVYRGGLDWLKNNLSDFIERMRTGSGSLDTSHFHYAHFYAVQSMWNAPEDHYFDDYFPAIREYLLAEQQTTGTGGWPSSSYGEAYSTAYALLILQVPMQNLPLFNK